MKNVNSFTAVLIQLFIFLGFIFFAEISYSQSRIEGTALDSISGEPVMFATIALYKENVLIKAADTDFDGRFIISDVDSGTYVLEASFLGYKPKKSEEVEVKKDSLTIVDFKMNQSGEIILSHSTCHLNRLTEIEDYNSSPLITAENIKNLPTKDIREISTGEKSYYYIDGVRVDFTNHRISDSNHKVDKKQIRKINKALRKKRRMERKGERKRKKIQRIVNRRFKRKTK